MTSCTPTPTQDAGPSTSASSPPSTTQTGTLPGTGAARFFTQQIAWKPCPTTTSTSAVGGRQVDCGSVAAPLDYAQPEGRQVALSLIRVRVPESARAQRIGTLLVNPGGPGASGVEFVGGQAEQLAAGIGDRFDIVGFDPRGIGASTPAIRCLTDSERDAVRAADLRNDHTEQGVARQEQQARDFATKCADRTGADVLAHVGTADVVDDMDLLRRVLGDEKLTYLGYSYGTFLGARYAQKYPDKVRAMVLDGAVNPAENTATMTVNQYAGLQQALDTYAADCATRRATDCPLGADPTPTATTAVFQNIVHSLIGNPAPAGTRQLTYGDAIDGATQALYSPSLWPYLTIGLQNLRDRRDGRTLLKLADAFNNRKADGTYTNATDALTAITCLDTDRITTQQQAAALEQQVRAAAPFTDDGRIGTGSRGVRDSCAFWPTPPTTLPQLITPAPTLPPVAVVSTTGDPATPYANGVALAQQLGARLVTVEGTQHTSSFSGNNTCLDAPLRTYLTASQPAAITRLVCPAT
ncbi:hypothetical protein AXK56_18230 [Tsukamurella pulmonis]|nr:hypothetical protein AXK56_18230 [Tsukamurella pulmonis]